METFERNICLRCKIPIHHLSDFGTNKDRTINTDYCRECFSKGVFVDRGVSKEEKIERNLTATR